VLQELLGAAAQQNAQVLAVLGEINPVTPAEIDPEVERKN
jgi:hypothetical protein